MFEPLRNAVCALEPPPASDASEPPEGGVAPSPKIKALLRTTRKTKVFGFVPVLLLLVARPGLAALTVVLLRRLGVLGKRRARFIPAILSLPIVASFCAPNLSFRTLQALLLKCWGLTLVRVDSAEKLCQGVFHAAAGSIGAKVAAQARLAEKIRTYRSPFLNGDWNTIFPAAMHLVRQARGNGGGDKGGGGSPHWHRKLLQSTCVHDGSEVFATDWRFPSALDTTEAAAGGGVCVLLAGLGGDSSAGHVQDVAEGFLAAGWAACALNPRGMKNSPRVNRPENIFRPFGSEDLEVVLDYIRRHTAAAAAAAKDAGTEKQGADVVLVGFSLGAIQLGKFLATRGPTVPREVRGAVLFSGAFAMDFADWWRYRGIFQPLIAPAIVGHLVATYGAELESKLSPAQLSKACRATSYETVFTELFLPMIKEGENAGKTQEDGGGELPQTYVEFQALAASGPEDRSRIARPTLLVTALDDPLHKPEMLGFSTKDAVDSEHLIYMVTEEGGHVAWPGLLNGSSPFMRATALDFARAVVDRELG